MLTNNAEFSYRVLATALDDAEFCGMPAELTLVGISSDTRTIKPGALFVALKGERFDAHDYLDVAVVAGAGALLVNRSARSDWAPLAQRIPLILVDDSLRALGSLALAHRRQFEIPLVAVAGSAGKTTTKDLCAAVLQSQFTTLLTEGNYNNRVGVPLTLLQLNSSHQAAVIEIGTNEPGEIAELARICAPTHGLITCIAKEHLEKLIDIDGVEREELALFDWLEANDGTPLVNLDDERLMRQRNRPRACTYGQTDDAEISIKLALNSDVQPQLQINTSSGKQALPLRLTGRVAGLNAISAIAVGVTLKIPLKQICIALGAYEPASGGDYARMRLEDLGGVTVLNDSYNAHPASMRAALETLNCMPRTGRVFAALGDMRELGTHEQAEHQTLLAHIAADYPEQHSILVGPAFSDALDGGNFPKMQACASAEEAALVLEGMLHSGDVLLVKGSRGLSMEKLLTKLRMTWPHSGSI